MNEENNSKNMKILIGCLDELGYDYEVSPNGNSASFSLDTESNFGTIHLTYGFISSCILTEAHVDAKIPEEQLTAVNEFITRLNTRVAYCCFAIDYDERAVYYRITTNIERTGFNERIFCLHRDNSRVGFHFYGNELLKVMYGALSPAEAIEAAEHKNDKQKSKRRAV